MIFLGNDHGGYELAIKLYEKMSSDYMHIRHVGCCSTIPTDYPLFAKRVAEELKHFSMFRGILICGTGIGMAMAANRNSWIRAAVCERPSQAYYARSHNDANVLCLAGRYLTIEDAWPVVDTFLHTNSSIEKRHSDRRKMFSSD